MEAITKRRGEAMREIIQTYGVERKSPESNFKDAMEKILSLTLLTQEPEIIKIKINKRKR